MRDKSITCAPAGIATFGPTARILVPSTRITWFVRMRPPSASRRRPARIAVTGAAGCWAASVTPASAHSTNENATRRMEPPLSNSQVGLVGKAVAYATYPIYQSYATCPADPLSGLRSTRHTTTSGPCVLVEPAHHVELRSDV